MNLEEMTQFMQKCGIVDEGDIVSDDDFEMSVELTDEDLELL